MSRRITVTEASRNFSDVVNRAYYRNEETILTRNGQPVAKITRAEPEYKTVGEALEAMKTMHHLTIEEAEAFENDIEDGKKIFLPLKSPWD